MTTDDDGTAEPIRIKIRGIYTTALTRLLTEAGHGVVQASPPIRRRFDRAFPVAPFDARIETGPDRQGVAVHGPPPALDRLRETLTVAVDTLAWRDPVPEHAVYHGRVTETLGGGAVVALGVDAPGGHDATGYLPYGETDDHVTVGDTLVVQVDAATAPWDDDRPTLTTRLSGPGGLGRLVRGRSEVRVRGGDRAAARELTGMTDLLDTTTPDGWAVEWSRDAPDAGLDALETALDRAGEHAAEVETAVGEPAAAPATLATPTATDWVWFGRAARFTLDDHRRTVTSTMPGHHRTKAASRAASGGVDLAEALCSFDGDADGDQDFPFMVVTDQYGPTVGDRIDIGHGKPDGRLVSLGRGEVTEREPDGTVAVERSMSAGGTYDALDVPREQGDVALTKFREGRWWYPTVYRSADGERKGTYVNVCTPVEVFPDGVRYVDLHVDVVRGPDGVVERVDDAELDAAVEAGHLREQTADRARRVATSVERALE